MRNIRNLKFRIYSFEARCAAIISEGLVGGKGKQPILLQLKRELDIFRYKVALNVNEANNLWRSLVNLYTVISKKVWGRRTDYESVYRAIRAVLPVLEKIKNGIGRDVESRDKLDYISRVINRGIFYLCSRHTNCAEGHKNYQGKIYVSENWRDRCFDSATKKRVAAYIKNHNCKTVEEIVDDPIYMVTRPNCRHYFVEIDIEEVMHNGVKKLLKNHNMVHARVNSYEYSQYRNYYERLKVLIALRKICPCLKLEEDITKTRRKMKKWLAMVSR